MMQIEHTIGSGASLLVCKDSNSIDTTIKKVRFLPFPVAGRAPETNWAFGVAFATIFKTRNNDTILRTSTIPGGILYTLRNQIIAGIGANIYFPGEKYVFRFESTYSKFPDRFWGLGNNAPESAMENYSFSQLFLNPQFLRKVYKDYFFGFSYEYQKVYYINYLSGGLFDQESITGKHGGSVSGLGYEISKDSRNNSYSPSKGYLVRLMSVFFNKVFLSDFNYHSSEIDIRKYSTIYKDHVLCFQLSSTVTTGNVPFRNLAILGGNNIMRGYYSGRYRDFTVVAFQGEYRLPLLWRFGAVAFAGLGEVSNSFKNFSFTAIKYSLGGGLRFAILPKEKLNFRSDYGFGNNSRNFYIVLSEAF